MKDRRVKIAAGAVTVNGIAAASKIQLKPSVPGPPGCIVEYCCGSDSLIGTHADNNCEVLRLTKAEDMRNPEI